MTTKGQEFLRSLLDGMSPEDRKDLLREIQKEKPAAKQHRPSGGPVTTYTTVLNKYHCITCDSRFERKYAMHRGEQVCAIDEKGVIHSLNVTGKPGVVEIPHTISSCQFCAGTIKYWDRARLEQAYLDMSAETPMCYKQFAMKKRREADKDGPIPSPIYHKDFKEEFDPV